MKLLTTAEVATILGQTQRNVLFLIKSNKITPALILANGNYLFNESDIVLFNSNKKSNAKQ
jgi:hypothetical protein